jgi:ElaB/YqjD/DUF883 family membrane-anchored ribosome-binding protein
LIVERMNAKQEDTMDRKHVKGGRLVWLGLGLALSIGACDRSEADEGVRDVKKAGNEVKAVVEEAAQTAKRGAERVRDELPAATERAKQEIDAVGDGVKDVLSATGQKVREEANEAREAVRKHEPKRD